MNNLKYRTFVESIFQKLKNENNSFLLPVYQDTKHVANLRIITKSMLSSSHNIRLLTKWRSEHQDAFPSQFKVTFEGTKKWGQAQLLNLSDRVLFFLETLEGEPYA